jgi:HTH-type transcriptional regulator / antitoxin HigA
LANAVRLSLRTTQPNATSETETQTTYETERALETEERKVIRMTAEERSTKTGDTYLDLVKQHPLRSIRSEGELDAAQAVIDDLFRRELDDAGHAYLDALSDLVILYERDHHPIPPLAPHELLAYMLEERGLSQADLVRTTGLAKATVSDLVSGKRAFTVAQMHRVGAVFGLPATVFLPPAPSMDG